MSAADAWQHTGGLSDRSYPSGRVPAPGDRARRAGRGTPPPPARPPARAAAEDRWSRYEDSGEFERPRAAAAGPRGRTAPTQQGGGRLRGVVAVLAVFLVTLAGAAVDSFLGIGLGTVTLVALVGSTAVATFLVRRRDLFSVLVAPPLVFVAVAVADLAIAPSAHFSLTAMAPLLIRGFPAMGIATAVGLVLALVRRAAGR
jgi:hypothetical protein